AASITRLETLRKEIAELKASSSGMQQQWKAEKESLKKIQEKREKLDQYRRQLEDAENNYDLNAAAVLRHGKIPELEKELAALEADLKKDGAARVLHEEVTDDEIAGVVARWTGIPVAKLVEGEREKVLRLGDTLKERVIGQDRAVELVTEAVWRARAGI